MIAQKIQDGMAARSWRVEHLSVHSGIPKSTIDAILSGRRKLSEAQRACINAAFGWSDGWHLEPTNDKEMTDEADQGQAAQ